MKNIVTQLSMISIGLFVFSCNSSSGPSDSSSPQIPGSYASGVSRQQEGPNTVCIKDTVSVVVLGGTLNVGGADILSGDLLALNNSSVQLGGSVVLEGTLYLNSSAQVHEGGADIIDGGIVQANQSENTSLITSFINSLSSLQPTQDFDTIRNSIVIHSTGAVNVIAIQNIELSGTQQITLDGASTDIFILNVSGSISTGGGASGVYLSGGLVPKNVIINNIGSGPGISIGGADIINGTLIGQERSINIGGANIINGAIVIGNGISIGGANSVMSPQGFCGVTTPPNPTPSPSPTDTSTPNPSPSASPSPSPSPSSTPTPTPSPTSSGGAGDCGDLVCPTGPLGGGTIGI